MNAITKTVLGLAAAAAAVSGSIAGKEGRGSIGLNNLPSGDASIGYHYDLTGNTVYGSATPVTFTDKYAAAFINDITISLSRTDKHYTDDPSQAWTVWTFEVCKGIDGDDAWFVVEFGN